MFNTRANVQHVSFNSFFGFTKVRFAGRLVVEKMPVDAA